MTRFALITGGSTGLGAHLVRRFWLDGYSILIVARTRTRILSVLDEVPQRVDQIARLFPCDLSNAKSVVRLLHSVKEEISHLDVLVNNAAIQGPIGPLGDNELSSWQRALQVNLFAPVALCHGLIPLMRGSGGASIINLSGGGATSPRPNFSAYATAKAGLVRFSETISHELKDDGIRVNCIAPGAMKTKLLQEVLEKSDAAGEPEVSVAKEVFANGGSSMDRVADLALFLASDASKGVSGKLISAVWDNWENWPKHLDELSQSDVYTLRRIAGRDRGYQWGDN